MLSLDREISFIKNIPAVGPRIANGLQRMQDAVNQLAVNLGADPTGTMPPPPPHQSLDVKASGGLVHIVATDHSVINKGEANFLEYATDPAFAKPLVVDMGASRSHTITLPGLTDSSAPQAFYFRTYKQARGGQPSSPTNFGGVKPTPVLPGGTVAMTLLPSTGSGTATNNGQQGGSGYGKVLVRPATGG
jgi:hypothetical protein